MSTVCIDEQANTLADAIGAALRSVGDPELQGVSIVELGMIGGIVVDATTVRVGLRPTFLGCPALAIIRSDIDQACRDAGATVVTIVEEWTPAWSPSAITTAGREQLAALGVSVDRRCPYCGSETLSSLGAVGAASCRESAQCASCRSIVDLMRHVEPQRVSFRKRAL